MGNGIFAVVIEFITFFEFPILVDAPNVILDVGDLDKLNSKGINVEKK
jgi:hypothetical protein